MILVGIHYNINVKGKFRVGYAAVYAGVGAADEVVPSLAMAPIPFGPSARAMISSATMRPDRVAPSMESK
jgi:hypothetical protein